MRLSAGSAWLLLAALLSAPACGLTEQGGLDSNADAGAAGGSGGGVNNGTCFPGSKVCPDASGQLACVDANTPETGCSDSTGCTPCPLPHTGAKCAEGGECLIDQCDAGWQDCNASPADGCETNVGGDPSNCGVCGNDCKATNGPNWICEAGVCIVNYCDPDTLLDCDKDKTNGCEIDSNTDVKNCKFCGNACSLTHATNDCVAQACKIKGCDAGWRDCDGQEVNGCETNVATDPGNCGGCGNQCDGTHGVPGCNAGKCAILCSGTFGNCDGDAGNGCEMDTSQSPSHCGACGKVCALAHADQACAAGACAIAGCKAGWGDCDGKLATGCEANLSTDATHCGSCDTVCSAPANASPGCGAGSCGFNCNQNFSTCGAGSTCFNTLTDGAHCGSTCKSCPPPPSGDGSPTCSNGACTVTCTPGFNKCGADCFNLKADASHCGSCTKVCGGGKVCANSSCVCPNGAMDCGNGVCVECCGNGDCGGGDKCCTGVCKKGAC